MPRPDDVVDAILREEREFVHGLGGLSLELAGGRLVTHERLPVPRFNFVQEVWAPPGRQTAFFERCLDHYFQRALRPSVRVRAPAAAHLARTLSELGFLRSSSLGWFSGPFGARGRSGQAPPAVRRARRDELETVVGFLDAGVDPLELLRSLEVAWDHPCEREAFLPILAESDRTIVSAGILHRFGASWGFHGVATQPVARGRGFATGLVEGVLAGEVDLELGDALAIPSVHPELDRRFREIGLAEVGRFDVFELPPDAELTLPVPPPSAGPQWRPPR